MPKKQDSRPRRPAKTDAKVPPKIKAFLSVARGRHPSLSGEDAIYSGLIGDWSIRSVSHGSDGKRTSVGTWQFRWVLEGLAIEDVIQGHVMPGSTYVGGIALRFYDTQQKLWRIVYVEPPTNTIIELAARRSGIKIVQEGRSGKKSHRWTFERIAAHSFYWTERVSSDGGKTWRLAQEIHANRAT